MSEAVDSSDAVVEASNGETGKNSEDYWIKRLKERLNNLGEFLQIVILTASFFGLVIICFPVLFFLAMICFSMSVTGGIFLNDYPGLISMMIVGLVGLLAILIVSVLFFLGGLVLLVIFYRYYQHNKLQDESDSDIEDSSKEDEINNIKETGEVTGVDVELPPTQDESESVVSNPSIEVIPEPSSIEVVNLEQENFETVESPQEVVEESNISNLGNMDSSISVPLESENSVEESVVESTVSPEVVVVD